MLPAPHLLLTGPVGVLSSSAPGSHSHPPAPGRSEERVHAPAGDKAAASKDHRRPAGPAGGARVPSEPVAGAESEIAEACEVVWAPCSWPPLPTNPCCFGALSLHGPPEGEEEGPAWNPGRSSQHISAAFHRKWAVEAIRSRGSWVLVSTP